MKDGLYTAFEAQCSRYVVWELPGQGTSRIAVGIVYASCITWYAGIRNPGRRYSLQAGGAGSWKGQMNIHSDVLFPE